MFYVKIFDNDSCGVVGTMNRMKLNLDNHHSANINAANMNGYYLGPERRIERRRFNSNRRLETLLQDFGLNRRVNEERRKKDTSWLLMSKVVN